MAAREQTGDSELYRLVLAHNDFTNLLRESVNVIGHLGTICGNNGFRKHDVGGISFRLVTFAGALVSSLNLINQVFLRLFAVVSQGHAASLRVVGTFSTLARARHCRPRMSFDRGRGRMRVAITFRYQAQHERHHNEDCYSSFYRSKAESLPHFIEFETPALFNHKVTSGFSRKARAGFRACSSRNS